MFSHLSISRRILLLATISILLFAADILFQTQDRRDQVLDTSKERLVRLVEMAHSVLEGFHQRSVSGELSPEQAKAAAIRVIRDLRYEDKQYFWLNDMEPRSVMHPLRPHMEGAFVGFVEDSEGRRIYDEFVQTVRDRGAGFVSYYWTSPLSRSAEDPGSQILKLSYVREFQPWGWIIGSGIDSAEIDRAYRRELVDGLTGLLLKLLVLAGLFWLIFQNLIRPLKSTTLAMRDIALAGNELTARLPVEGRNEFSELAASFNGFARNAFEANQMLAAREQRLREAQRLAHIGNWEWNTADHSMYWSDEIYRILGYRKGEVRPDPELFRQQLTGEERLPLQAAVDSALSGKKYNLVYRLRRPDGQLIHVRERGKLVRTHSSQPAVLVGTLQDITSQVELREAVEEKRQLYQQMFENNPSIKLLIDPAGGSIVDANPAALNFYGYSKKQIRELNIGQINALPENEIQQMIALAREEKKKFFNFRHKLAGGEVRDVEVYTGPVTLRNKTYLHSIIFDVTHRTSVQRRLEQAALHDPLTGMNNRRVIDTQGQRLFSAARRNGSPCSVIMIDIDHFKRINDRYGHPVGDLVLKSVAEEITGFARDADLTGRYGGEEFVVIAPDTDLSGGHRLATRILSQIRKKEMNILQHRIQVTVSAGVAVTAPDDQEFNAVIERADFYLYQAKRRGRDRVCDQTGTGALYGIDCASTE